MTFDISDLLSSWEYQAGQVVVRKFQGRDGKEKIQLRVDLGLLQMNALGRPDGKQPFGHESLLEHYQARLLSWKKKHEGTEEGFKLSAEDCSRLQQEAIQFHHRYICLFQLQDYASVLRDTERNLRVFDFVEKHAESRELSWALQQLRPQLMMMHLRARAALAQEAGEPQKAIDLVREGIEELREFYHKMERPELADTSAEIQALQTWLGDLESTRPLSEREKIEKALEEAIRREDYEKAAFYRDRLKSLS